MSPASAQEDGPDRGSDRGPGDAADGAHEDRGLELARSVARSLARGRPGRSRPAGRRTPAEPRSSGAHPDDRDPQTLDATIGRLIAQQGWGADVRVHGVFSRWDAIVGREVAQHVRPVSYQRDEGQAQADSSGRREGPPGAGRLVVQADSTAWATQMRLLAATVVRRLNQELGDGTVSVIDVQGPRVPSWRRGARSVRGGRGPRDTYG